MDDVRILEADRGPLFDRFVRFPWELYRDDPLWPAVPPAVERGSFDPRVEPERGEVDLRLFLAESRGRSVGRIAAFTRLADRDPRTGYFGFFESTDHQQAGGRLLATAEGVLRARGCTRIFGPMSYSNLSRFTFLARGFDHPPRILTQYNRAGYDPLIRACGYAVESEYVGYTFSKNPDGTWPAVSRDLLADRLAAMPALQRRRGITIRPVDLRDQAREARRFADLYNESFEGTHGFVSLSLEKSLSYFRDLGRVADPNYVTTAFVGSEPAGFCLTLPDANIALRRAGHSLPGVWHLKLLLGLRRVDVLRLAILGVRPRYRQTGAPWVLVMDQLAKFARSAYRALEISLVEKYNTALIPILKEFGCTPTKEWRLYVKNL